MKKLSAEKKRKGAVTQITQLEDDLIELILADSSSSANVYFTKEQWENFKKAINEFEYDKTPSIDGKATGITVHIYQDGNRVHLNLVDDNISSLPSFREAEWERFKKQVNEFKYNA